MPVLTQQSSGAAAGAGRGQGLAAQGCRGANPPEGLSTPLQTPGTGVGEGSRATKGPLVRRWQRKVALGTAEQSCDCSWQLLRNSFGRQH